MHLLALPAVMLEHALSFLSYDQVARYRLVCKDFDIICQRVLNRGFQRVEKRLTMSLRAIKAQLPRRESERRFHPLAKHCDILISVETRVSMLSMAYSRFIEQGRCCFIPGKILDELHRVLSIVNESNTLPMAFEVLQELRDISGMAIEHFDEAVAPTLRQKMDEFTPSKMLVPLALNRSGLERIQLKPPVGNSVEMALLREACLRNNRSILKIEKRNNLLTRKLELYKRMMTLAKRLMIQKQIEQSYKIAELKRKVDEYEIKFNELSLTQHSGYKNCFKDADSINRISTTLPNSPKMSTVKMRPKHFSSQIKLDPSPLRIGLNKCGRGSPIIKRRRASLNLPSPKYLNGAHQAEDDSKVMTNEDDSYNILNFEVDSVLRNINTALQERAERNKKNGMECPGPSTSKEECEAPPTFDDQIKDTSDENAHKLKRKLTYLEKFKQHLKPSKDDTAIQALSDTIMKLLDVISEKGAKRRKIQSE